jgi:hypothetical protein
MNCMSDDFINYIISIILCSCISVLTMFIGYLVASPMGN